VDRLGAAVWSKFRDLPTWVQVLLWFAIAPVLGAVAVLKRSPGDMAHRVAAGLVLVVGGFVWVGAYASEPAGAPSNEPVAADEQSPSDEAPDDDPSPERTADPTSSPSAASAVPSPAPAATPTPSPSPTPQPTAELASVSWTVVNVVDGDTLDVRNDQGTERVRVVGIDTPERGECGYGEARDALASLVLDREVKLVAGARDDRDMYDRILRYVDVAGVDAGLSLIQQGLAIARYDSRDGYGHHPRQDRYVEADAATDQFSCAAPKPSPSTAPPPPPAPEPEPEPEPASNPWGTSSCHPAYDPCVPPKSEVGDLNCPDIRKHYPNGVSVNHAHGDPHGLDRDKDGHGCE
jgi:endonuclease YncB( thermonuclease family)